jgi:hypothetical protein
MSLGRIGARGALVVGVVSASVVLIAAPAFGEAKTFSEQGCSNWEVPAGVSQLLVTAVGGAGHAAEGSEPGAGGNGDELKAAVTVAPGQLLDVCVAQGAGKGGEELGGATGGGNGGGASGLARSKDFSAPVVIAGGGGGGGQRTAGLGSEPGLPGGAAGNPGGFGTRGGTVGGGSPTTSGGPGVGGHGAKAFTFINKGNEPVLAGAGGGGGGGFVGGGGGKEGGGGAGGTDLCEGTGVTGCTTTDGAGTGAGSVTLTYTTLPTSKDQCKHGGWKSFGGMFKNQGQCVSFVRHRRQERRFRWHRQRR